MNQAIIDSKKAVVSEIAQKMKESQSTVVVEYRGHTQVGHHEGVSAVPPGQGKRERSLLVGCLT